MIIYFQTPVKRHPLNFNPEVKIKKLPRNWVILGRRSKFLYHDVGDKKRLSIVPNMSTGYVGVIDEMTYPDKPGNRVSTLLW